MLVFPVATYPWKAFVAITAVTLVVPLAVIAVVLAAAAAVPGWLLVTALAGAIGLLLSVNVGLTAFALYVATHNEITIRGGAMHLKGGEFHERVPLDAIVDAEIIDLSRRRALARARRRSGVVLPGFRIGWFETSGGEWLFVLRGSQRTLLYVRTDQSFSTLLGVQEPDALRRRLLAPDTVRRH